MRGFLIALFALVAMILVVPETNAHYGPIVSTARIAVRVVEQTIVAANCRQCERQARRQARRANWLARISAVYGNSSGGSAGNMSSAAEGYGSTGSSLSYFKSPVETETTDSDCPDCINTTTEVKSPNQPDLAIDREKKESPRCLCENCACIDCRCDLEGQSEKIITNLVSLLVLRE